MVRGAYPTSAISKGFSLLGKSLCKVDGVVDGVTREGELLVKTGSDGAKTSDNNGGKGLCALGILCDTEVNFEPIP